LQYFIAKGEEEYGEEMREGEFFSIHISYGSVVARWYTINSDIFEKKKNE
jgi:hypothetical protein